jgi:hypothetical protein
MAGRRESCRYETSARNRCVVITFAEAKEIVRAAEEPGWTLGTYVI